MSTRIMVGDVREQLRLLPDESVHCCVTSPPYFGLRDYGVDGQIGLEPTVADHIFAMLAVFREVRRVLRKDGTLWLNYGDCYCAGGRGGGGTYADERPGWSGQPMEFGKKRGMAGFKPKDRMMLPARLAIALCDDGWYLRDEIVWHKPNPMPSSVQDRTTPAHEMIYLLSKSRRYYYDAEAIKEPMADSSVGRLTQASINGQNGGAKGEMYEALGLNERTGSRKPNQIVQGLAARRGRNASAAHKRLNNQDEKLVAGEKWGARHEGWEAVRDSLGGRNKRSVWTVATEAFPDAHFATFPTALIEPMILAGCPLRCCAKCGAPWVRETERSVAPPPDRINNNPFKHDSMTTHGEGAHTLRNIVTHETLGFSPSCKCDAGTVPGTVLDPFGGSGTTALVADRLGRNAILCELNPDYAAMARRRLTKDAGMFAEVAE